MNVILYRGGVVCTALSVGQRPPDTLLVVDQKIAWIGTSSDASFPSEIAGAAEVVELDGALLTPVFHDAHVDITELGRAQTGGESTDREEALHAGLRAAARAGVSVLNHHPRHGGASARELEHIAQLTADPENGYPLTFVFGGGQIEDVERGQEILDSAPSLSGFGPAHVDGTIASHQAALNERYFDLSAPQWSGDDPGVGELLLAAEDCARNIIAATRLQRPAVLHARGDRALDALVAGFRLAEAEVGIEALIAVGHQIIGAELIDTAALSALVEFGGYIINNPREQAEYGDEDGLYERRLGPVRSLDINPWADLVTSGVELLFGSFAPEWELNPWATVYAGIRHQDRGQRLSMIDSFGAHTGGNISLEIGTPATFAIWEPVDIEMYPLRSGSGFGQAAANLPLPALSVLERTAGQKIPLECRTLLRAGVECA